MDRKILENFRKKRAFTIVEIVIVLLVITFLVGILSFFSSGFLARQSLRDETEALVGRLKTLYTRAKSGYLNDHWSVFFEVNNNRYTLFKGNNLALRDTAYDEPYTVKQPIDIQGVTFSGSATFLTFLKPYGNANERTLIELKDNKSGRTTVRVNPLGLISVAAEEAVYVPVEIPRQQYAVDLPSQSDSNMYAGLVGQNYGNDANIWVQTWASNYHRRGIIRFDLSSIPTDAEVMQANLTVYVVNTHGTARNYGLHLVSQSPARDWVENQVTWNRYKSATNWSSGGGDFAPSASAVKSAGSWPGTPYAVTFAVAADVQDFVSNPNRNFGWIIKDENEGMTAQFYVHFASKEHATAGYRPVLHVEYER